MGNQTARTLRLGLLFTCMASNLESVFARPRLWSLLGRGQQQHQPHHHIRQQVQQQISVSRLYATEQRPPSSSRSPRSPQSSRRSTRVSNKPPDTSITDAHAISLLATVTPNDQLVVVLVGIPGCGKSTVAAKIAGTSSRATGTGTRTEEAQAFSSATGEEDSGKISGEIEQTGGPRRQWLVACQDVLKSRNNVLSVASAALARGQSVVIDRCNFDASQRMSWIQMAAQHRRDLQRKSEPDSGPQSQSAAKGALADLVDGEEPAAAAAAADRVSGRVLTVCVVLPRPNDAEFCSRRASSRGDPDGVHTPGTDWSVVCQRMRGEFVYPRTDEGFDATYFCTDSVALERITDLLGQ